MYPKICLLYKKCHSSYKKEGKKRFINKNIRTRPKTIERAELNLIETTVRAETYPVKDYSSTLIGLPLLELELPPLAAA